MDEFGVLTERFGLKPQGKAAPMAASKRTVDNSNGQSWDFGVDSSVNPKPSTLLGDHNGFFPSRGDSKPYNSGAPGGYDDIFGHVNPTKQSAPPAGSSSFDYDSFFLGSNANSSSFQAYDNDDIFGGMPAVRSSVSARNDSKNDDFFGSFASPSKQSAPTDDLLGDFAGASAKPKGSSGSTTSNFDDLIPEFGANNGSSASKHSARQSTLHSTKSNFTSSEDPFVVLESISTSTLKNAYASSDFLYNPLEGSSKHKKSGGIKPPRLKSPPRGTQVFQGSKVKSSDVSSIDDLGDFARGRVQNNANGRSDSHSSREWPEISTNKTVSYSEDDLESFFSVSQGPRSVSAPRPRTTTTDPVFDVPTNQRGGPPPRVSQKTSSDTSPFIKKSFSDGRTVDDLFSLFGDAQIFGQFEEVEDESEERRNLRHQRYQRTQERMYEAVNDMKQRDFRTQQEQEERRRIAETMDVEIKRWAAGKEGNMRALLSSLQHVLWPECGWQSVSLTDLITSDSVKKVHRKAKLCVHPDKVQQKGANLQQKFIAEKVFDILQEAWKKFEKEELS